MGVFISESSLRRAEVGADVAEQRLDAGRLYDPEPIPAEVLSAMLTECVRTGSLETTLPVPEWGRRACLRKQAPAAEIAREEIGADDALLDRVIGVLGRAMATDPEALAVVAQIAQRYGDFHGVKAS